MEFSKGKLVLVAIGKAAWSMSRAACDLPADRISDGVVITKYGHAQGDLPNVRIFEAGHPVPDANSFSATEEAIKLVQGLTAEDTVLFLISGGGSALFETTGRRDLQDSTEQPCLRCHITEINTDP